MRQEKFNVIRMGAVMVKEFIQMRRDRLTFSMMVGIPLLQLILFGFAINSNPKNLPTVVVSGEQTPMVRTFLTALENTDYFDIIKVNASEAEADGMIARGEALFAVNIPNGFSRKLLRGEQPEMLITADGTDPVAVVNAVAAVNGLAGRVFRPDLEDGLRDLLPGERLFETNVHARYNPEADSQINTVPGLMGVVLTMTMVMITALAITREYERGTMEALLAMPVRPLEVMLGKIIPYIMVGYVQQLLVVMVGVVLFGVPMEGSLLLLVGLTLPFITANLSMGLTFSTLARNQLQAMQTAFFFFLPSILLSGFMFPFKGMPGWAQVIGECLPLTHFLRIVRGVLLKGNTFVDLWPEVWPILIFMCVALMVGLLRYRRTLD